MERRGRGVAGRHSSGRLSPSSPTLLESGARPGLLGPVIGLPQPLGQTIGSRPFSSSRTFFLSEPWPPASATGWGTPVRSAPGEQQRTER